METDSLETLSVSCYNSSSQVMGYSLNGKGKAIPVQASINPERYRSLRLPDFNL